MKISVIKDREKQLVETCENLLTLSQAIQGEGKDFKQLMLSKVRSDTRNLNDLIYQLDRLYLGLNK